LENFMYLDQQLFWQWHIPKNILWVKLYF
jgi:hypothetical protein